MIQESLPQNVLQFVNPCKMYKGFNLPCANERLYWVLRKGTGRRRANAYPKSLQGSNQSFMGQDGIFRLLGDQLIKYV
jgi:hypothetical protein